MSATEDANNTRPNAGKTFSVGQLTLSIRRNLLANNSKIDGVWITGEVSGCKYYNSGHRYFTLKDDTAAIGCRLMSFSLRGCSDAVKGMLPLQCSQMDAAINGRKVRVQGQMDFNMQRGIYGLQIQKMELLDGDGDKMAAFNALKAKLEAEGLNKLDHPEKRRRLPFLPHRIAIVTSESGAVIHDMGTTLTRRFPNLEIRLFPAKVQGDTAIRSLIAGIRFFQTDPWNPEVLILARGGGSVEDLWVFNEEPLVRELAASRIPVISAVGHESDTTLCDYVADLRAGTPSIAAECVVPEKAKLVAVVQDLQKRMVQALKNSYSIAAQNCDYWEDRLHKAPTLRLTRLDGVLRQLSVRLVPALKNSITRYEILLQRASLRLEPPLRNALQRAESAVRQESAKLRLLSPYSVLERGYSITLDASGAVVRSADTVKPGDELITRLQDGSVTSQVTRG